MHITIEELKELKKEDLIQHANMHHDLHVNQGNSKAEIIDLIQKVNALHKGNQDFTTVPKGVDVEVPPGYTKFRVSPGSHNDSGRPIFVGHQFKSALVPVNVDLIAPNKWVNSLKDAVRDKYYRDHESGEWVPQQVEAYPVSVLQVG